MKNPDTLQAFIDTPSPVTALALAISDHKGGKLVDWPFVDQLNEAKRRAEIYPELVTALRGIAEYAALCKGTDVERIAYLAGQTLAKLPSPQP